MRRRLLICIAAVVLAAGVGSAAVPIHATSASGGVGPLSATNARAFVGYWMGIDPLDGGDSRRGITPNGDGTFSVIGRDTVFTLCDGTDRAVITFDDAAIVGSALVTDNALLTCTNGGSTLSLKVRFDVVGRNIVRETVTTQSGEPVDQIMFHRVSES